MSTVCKTVLAANVGISAIAGAITALTEMHAVGIANFPSALFRN